MVFDGSGKYLHITFALDKMSAAREVWYERKEYRVRQRIISFIIAILTSGLGDAKRIATLTPILIGCRPSIYSRTREINTISGDSGCVSHTVPLLIFNQSVHVWETTRCEGDHMITFSIRLMATLRNSEGAAAAAYCWGEQIIRNLQET